MCSPISCDANPSPDQESSETTCSAKELTPEEKLRLEHQNTRLITEHKSLMLEKNARKNWDLFYKRNENRFFKDRHWTTREFTELLDPNNCTLPEQKKVLLEVGCGVGNFIFPLIGAGLNYSIIACDLSPRAIDFVDKNPLNPHSSDLKAFQCDITNDGILSEVMLGGVDVVTLIFVLSAIHPDKFIQVLIRIHKLIKPGGILLFRDYGLYDMAQLRFKAGHKISDNFYVRQDGTRCYYFSTDFLQRLFTEAGFEVMVNDYIHRRTINKKEGIDVPRIFVQVKATKPLVSA